MYPDITILGVAMNEDGAAPMVHFINAPVTTCFAKTVSFKRNQPMCYRSPFRRNGIVFCAVEGPESLRNGWKCV